MAAGLTPLPSDPAFWHAYGTARVDLREQTVRSVIDSAEQLRRVNRFEPDHSVTAYLPRWMYDTLRASDLERLSAQHAIEVEVSKGATNGY